jgi:hypothetical protein
MGVNARHPAAVFTTLVLGERWVREHRLDGMLTWYPLDLSAYDWAIMKGVFKPNKPHQQTEAFMGSFSSAAQPHHHYEFSEELAPKNSVSFDID